MKVHPTRAGQAHAVTQLGDTEQASAERWKTMPPLSAVNPLEALKPGATALLSGTDERRRERVVLAYERYGRGKALAFPVQDSWMWQMHATIRVEDRRTRTSGASCCAGSWTACPTRSRRGRSPIASSRGSRSR